MPEFAVPPAPRAVDVLLVGGGVAAARCARTLRRAKFDGSILLVGEEPTLPYNRPPLSKELLRDDLPDDLVAAEPPGWWGRHRVDVVTGTAVVGLDLEGRSAELADGRSVTFDRCLLATGASPRALPVPGGERALVLRTLADARRLRAAAMEAGPGAPVVVVGGGFIGVEVASGLVALGLRATIVELSPSLWGGSLGPTLARRAADRLDAAGVALRLGTGVTAINATAAVAGGEEIPAALVVAGIGVVPREELAAAAGLDVSNGILVDEEGRTSAPGVWAAGDVARSPDGRFEHWHGAREAGERVGRSMLGLESGPVPPPWLFTEVAGQPLDVVGRVEPADAEHEITDGVLAFTRSPADAEPVTALAIEEGRLLTTRARELVALGATVADVRAAADSAV